MAQHVLVAHRRHGLQSRALGRRARAAQRQGIEHLSAVHDRGLSGGALDRRKSGRLGPHLPALPCARLQESRHRQVPGALRARLERHRLQGAHQDHEAPVGRHRHRVRRAPRALRDELFGQPRAGARVRRCSRRSSPARSSRWKRSPSAAWRTTTRTAGATRPITTAPTSRCSGKRRVGKIARAKPSILPAACEAILPTQSAYEVRPRGQSASPETVRVSHDLASDALCPPYFVTIRASRAGRNHRDRPTPDRPPESRMSSPPCRWSPASAPAPPSRGRCGASPRSRWHWR